MSANPLFSREKSRKYDGIGYRFRRFLPYLMAFDIEGTTTMTGTKLSLLLIFTVLSGGLSTSVLASQTGHWEWVDKDGQRQFSDRPPPSGVDAKYIDSSYSMSSPRTPKAESTNVKTEPATGNSSTDTGTEGAADKSTEPDKMEALPAKDPAVCEQAKNNLQALESAPRIRMTDADGKARFLSDEERNTQKDRARKAMELNCE